MTPSDCCESIRSAALTVETDGYMRLQYRVATGQMVASLGSYHEVDIREDLEMTLRLEPQMKVLAVIDLRPRRKRTPMEWYRPAKIGE